MENLERISVPALPLPEPPQELFVTAIGGQPDSHLIILRLSPVMGSRSSPSHFRAGFAPGGSSFLNSSWPKAEEPLSGSDLWLSQLRDPIKTHGSPNHLGGKSHHRTESAQRPSKTSHVFFRIGPIENETPFSRRQRRANPGYKEKCPFYSQG